MSARLMKKVLEEQAAAQQQQINSDDDSEPPHTSPPTRNLFDLLEDDDEISCGDHGYHKHSDQEKGKVAGETSDRGIAGEHSSMEKFAAKTVSTPNVKSKKKKKKKNREDLFPTNDLGVSNLMLENLSLGASSSGQQEIASYPAKTKSPNTDSDDKLLKKQFKTSILQVDPKFLSAENELRRIFGSRVVKSHERNHSSASSRLMRGGRRGSHNLKRTILVSPSQHWPRWDGSLSMELLETLDGVHYFRRGCHRSALEICKLLLSLDSDDPMGAMLCIDYYSLRAEEYAWLERFVEEYRCDNSLWLFPNFSYSLAICRFYLERDELSNNGEMDIGKAASFELMKQALMLHPSVLKKLVVKVPLKDRRWTTVLKHSFFGSEETGSPSLDHLIAIYVEKSYIIWRLPDLQKCLYDSALSVIEMLEEQGSDAKDWACVRKEAFSSEKNEYSHLLVSDFSDSMPTMPPDNLQDFMMVDQRGGIEQPQRIPENHVLRDVSNRSALAVLFESMLPWINYGTGDGEGEHIPNEQADQD